MRNIDQDISYSFIEKKTTSKLEAQQEHSPIYDSKTNSKNILNGKEITIEYIK